jgi:conjugal transfer pilus assembly protein TraA
VIFFGCKLLFDFLKKEVNMNAVLKKEALFSDKQLVMTVGLSFVAALAVAAVAAHAGTDTTFAAAQTTLSSWITGSLGRMIALASLGVGLVTAIVMKSLMPVAVSVGIGLTASIAVSVITGMVTATI